MFICLKYFLLLMFLCLKYFLLLMFLCLIKTYLCLIKTYLCLKNPFVYKVYLKSEYSATSHARALAPRVSRSRSSSLESSSFTLPRIFGNT